eukprot:scaffold5490_cov125-Cylindrotheca_fusiformis.AAC.19
MIRRLCCAVVIGCFHQFRTVIIPIVVFIVVVETGHVSIIVIIIVEHPSLFGWKPLEWINITTKMVLVGNNNNDDDPPRTSDDDGTTKAVVVVVNDVLQSRNPSSSRHQIRFVNQSTHLLDWPDGWVDGRTDGWMDGRTDLDQSSLVLTPRQVVAAVQNMDTYEANVIEQAERNLAPNLTGIGFPSLHSLTPSGNVESHVQDIQNVLQQTRSQIQQQQQNNNNNNIKLYWKQQMLLNLVQSVSSDMDFLIRPQQEYQQEIKRRRQQQQQQQIETSSQIPKTKTTDHLRPTNKVTFAMSKTPENPSQRLEAIKNQQQQQIQQRSRKRVSMQQRKKRRHSFGKATTNDNDNDNDEGEGDFTNSNIQKRLKKLRMEREKRRRKRKRRWQQDDNNNEEEEDEFELDDTPVSAGAEEEEEEEEGNEINKSKKPQTKIVAKSTRSVGPRKKKKQRKTSTTRTTTTCNTPTTMIECPLCQTSLAVPSKYVDNNNVDEFLSQHISTCQTTRRTRGLRRRSSRRTTTTTVPSYVEPTTTTTISTDGDEPEGEEEEEDDNDNDDNDDDDDDEAVIPSNDDTSDDDEVLVVDEDDKDELEDDNVNHQKQRKSTKAVVSIVKQQQRPTTSYAMDDWDEDDYEDRVDDWIETGIQNMKDMKERDVNEEPPGEEEYDGGLVVPAWINDRLFPYQRTAVQWMWELHQQQAGGIIGDEMGLGKTVQICAFLGSMASCRKLKSILVICPATMLQHWLKEMAKWAPGIRRILIHQSGEGSSNNNSTGGGIMKRAISPSMLSDADKWLKQCRRTRLFEAIDEEDLESRDPASFCGTGYAFLTTYENVRRNPDIWTNHKWSYVIMDEAQKIRNPDADVTLVCKVQVAYRCALILKDLINPYLLRRLKKDIKEVNRMPGKKEQVLFCRLTDRQRMLYEAFLQSDLVKNIIRGSTQLLGAITMLRKICNHPDLVCPPGKSSFDTFLANGSIDENDFNDYSDDEGSIDEEESLVERSGKLEVLAKILPLWHKQGHRVLIFCQWKKMLNIIQRFMMLKGWKFGRLDGNTNVGSRQRLVDSFNGDDSYFAMLCTTRTGGVGLNLTGADRIILYDPDWNPQTDAQARERAWRFGQEKEVVIFRLISAGTVEEKIYQRQIFKTALSNKVLQDARQRRLFSQKDLKDLFSLKADNGSVISGGDGLTETGELTKGDGYVDPDEDPSVDVDTGDGETMRTVLKSRGLAGVFDHGIVESTDVVKKASVREMEAKARQIAREAAGALQESVAEQESFSPTWTGSDRTQTGRFGSSRRVGTEPASRPMVAKAGISMSGTKASSASLLASIRERNQEVKSTGEKTNRNTKQYTDLLKRVRDFVKLNAPTTDELLDEFESVSNYDAAIFRRLLKSVAKFSEGRWRLR